MKAAILSILAAFTSLCLYGQASKVNPDPSRLSAAHINDTINERSLSGLAIPRGYIEFASAFRRNANGPTGGYWTENNSDDYTFRPVFSNVASYKLIIFNRNGYQVYETTDLYKGWDGYLKNGSPASQGVYIWKVTGKYSDGTPFYKVGDVTFIY